MWIEDASSFHVGFRMPKPELCASFNRAGLIHCLFEKRLSEWAWDERQGYTPLNKRTQRLAFGNMMLAKVLRDRGCTRSLLTIIRRNWPFLSFGGLNTSSYRFVRLSNRPYTGLNIHCPWQGSSRALWLEMGKTEMFRKTRLPLRSTLNRLHRCYMGSLLVVAGLWQE